MPSYIYIGATLFQDLKDVCQGVQNHRYSGPIELDSSGSKNRLMKCIIKERKELPYLQLSKNNEVEQQLREAAQNEEALADRTSGRAREPQLCPAIGSKAVQSICALQASRDRCIQTRAYVGKRKNKKPISSELPNANADADANHKKIAKEKAKALAEKYVDEAKKRVEEEDAKEKAKALAEKYVDEAKKRVEEEDAKAGAKSHSHMSATERIAKALGC